VLRLERYAIAFVLIAIAHFLVVVLIVDIFDSLSSCILLNRF
jgi:hypothetical protein